LLTSQSEAEQLREMEQKLIQAQNEVCSILYNGVTKTKPGYS